MTCGAIWLNGCCGRLQPNVVARTNLLWQWRWRRRSHWARREQGDHEDQDQNGKRIAAALNSWHQSRSFHQRNRGFCRTEVARLTQYWGNKFHLYLLYLATLLMAAFVTEGKPNDWRDSSVVQFFDRQCFRIRVVVTTFERQAGWPNLVKRLKHLARSMKRYKMMLWRALRLLSISEDARSLQTRNCLKPTSWDHRTDYHRQSHLLHRHHRPLPSP